jgi:hypothetical protein
MMWSFLGEGSRKRRKEMNLDNRSSVVMDSVGW